MKRPSTGTADSGFVRTLQQKRPLVMVMDTCSGGPVQIFHMLDRRMSVARSHLSSREAQGPAQDPPSSAGLSNIQLLGMAAKKAMETIRSIAMVLTGTTKLEKAGGPKPGGLNQGAKATNVAGSRRQAAQPRPFKAPLVAPVRYQ